MKNILRTGIWSPYVVGGWIGILSVMLFISMEGIFDALEVFARGAYLLNRLFLFLPSWLSYDGARLIDWHVMLFIGTFMGSAISATMAYAHQYEDVPKIWTDRFGSAKWFRYAGAFLGGMIVLFGVRLAGGCLWRQGIIGGLQLSLSGWLFLGAMFFGGIVTAHVLYGRM